MPESNLQLATPSDTNRLFSKLAIAAVAMCAVGAAVYFLNPRKTAEVRVQKVEIFAPHTEFKPMPGSEHVMGTPSSSEDDVYAVVTLHLEDKLGLPLFIQSTSATMTTKEGATVEATVISALDLAKLEQTFPQIVSMVSPPEAPPLQFQDSIAPGATRVGTVVLLFPQTTEQVWRAKGACTLTIHLADGAAPIEVNVP